MRKLWTPEEDSVVLAHALDGAPWREDLLPGRTARACSRRAVELAGGPVRRHPWTEAADRKIVDDFHQGLTAAESGRTLSPPRTSSAVVGRLVELRKKGASLPAVRSEAGLRAKKGANKRMRRFRVALSCGQADRLLELAREDGVTAAQYIEALVQKVFGPPA